MSDKDLIRASNQYAKEDRKKSWYYFLTTSALFLTLFAAVIVVQALLLKIFLAILFGLIICRLFVIYHDFRHHAILGQSLTAKCFMTVFGWFSLSPRSIWDESHEHHHNNNSKFSVFVMGSFPVMTTEKFYRSSKTEKIKYRIIRHPLIIAIAYLPVFIISFCLYPFFENPKKYWDCGIAFLLHVLMGITLYSLGGLLLILTGQTIPFLIFGAIGAYIFYAQHNFPGVRLKPDKEWDYLEAALYSSSYIKMNALWRWITANIGYHHIHHVNSRIPFYRLPEAMEQVREFQNPRETSLSPHDIRGCLKLKLWNEKESCLQGWMDS